MYPIDQDNITIIGETAFNHEGDFSYLFRLIDMVAQAGATHIKFQVLIDYDEFVSQRSTVYTLVRSWCFSYEQWNQAFNYAESIGLRLFVMPLDRQAVSLCLRDTVDCVEIHSVSFNDHVLLDEVRQKITNKVIGFGLGGRTLDELKAMELKFDNYKLLFLSGFQAFPSQLEDVKLSRISYLHNYFPKAIMGYADHSDPAHPDAIYSSHYAYQLGARVFEKHVTLESNRTDAQSAYMLSDFSNYISQLHRFIAIVSEEEKVAFDMTDRERVYRSRQKKAVAIKAVRKGELFKIENIALKMHTDEGDYSSLEALLDKPAKKDFLVGDVIC